MRISPGNYTSIYEAYGHKGGNIVWDEIRMKKVKKMIWDENVIWDEKKNYFSTSSALFRRLFTDESVTPRVVAKLRLARLSSYPLRMQTKLTGCKGFQRG